MPAAAQSAWASASRSDRVARLRGPGVRERPGPARLGPPRRPSDQARGDPSPREPARQADRLAVRQPRGPGRIGRRGACRRRGLRRDRQGSLRRRGLGHSRRRREPTRALLPRRAGAIGLLPQLGDPDDPPGPAPLRRQDRAAGAPLRAVERPDSPAHVDGRHGARPRLPAAARRRSTPQLPRHLRRHVHRPDIREHVPPPRTRDGPRRRPRPRPLHPGHAGELRPRAQVHRPRLRRVPVALRERRTGALRAGRPRPRDPAVRGVARRAPQGSDSGADGISARGAHLRRRPLGDRRQHERVARKLAGSGRRPRGAPPKGTVRSCSPRAGR